MTLYLLTRLQGIVCFAKIIFSRTSSKVLKQVFPTSKSRKNLCVSLASAVLVGTGVTLLCPARISHWTKAIAAETQAVTLQFQARVGSQSFSCDQNYMLGTPASSVTPLDFRFYVSDVALIDADGNAVPLTLEQDGQWQYANVALLDFEDQSGECANGTVEMNDRIVGSVPPGTYTGLQFTVGVPFDLNHADSTLAPSPLNLTSLWWNWQLGYKFVRIDLSNQNSMGMLPSHSGKHEGSHPSGSDSQTESPPGEEHSSQAFLIHLGSTGCEVTEGEHIPSSCSNPNRSTITLTEFNPSQNVIVADLGALVAQTNLSVNQPDTAPGCMSEPKDLDCVGIMEAIGIPSNGAPAQQQTFFRTDLLHE